MTNFNSISFAPKLTNCFQVQNMLVPNAHGQSAPTQATKYTPRVQQNSLVSFFCSPNFTLRCKGKIRKGNQLDVYFLLFLLQSSGKYNILHFPGKISPSLSEETAFLLLFLRKPSRMHRFASIHAAGYRPGQTLVSGFTPGFLSKGIICLAPN